MKYKKFRLILIALLVIVTVSVTILGLIGYNVVSAATEDGSDNTPAIVQKLADRFNLNPQEVQAVFTENRMDLKTEREQKFVDKLNKAVLDGKITEAQKSAIMTKRSEIQGRIDGLNNLSLEERKAVMQGIRDDVDKWKQENGANLGKFLNFGHRGIGWGCHKAEE